jgi:ATP-dependent DNA ligase
MASACKMQLEGIIGKRADAAYVSGRSTGWIKLKCLCARSSLSADSYGQKARNPAFER